MAGGGVGEAMLIGAAVGAGTGAVGSAIQDKDIGQGALMGGLMGAATGGIGSQLGGAAGSAIEGATAAAPVEGVASAAPAAVADTGAANAASQTMARIPGVGPAPGVYPSSVPTTLAQSVPNATVGATPAGLTTAQQVGAGATGGISGLMAANSQPTPYQAPGTEPYNGPLSKFKMAGPSLSQYNYDPNTFQPSIAPGFADGGIASIQTGMFPQSQMDRTQFATPTQMPVSREIIASDYDQTINPYTGDLPRFGEGGGINFIHNLQPGGEFGDITSDLYGVVQEHKPKWLQDMEPGGFIGATVPGKLDWEAKKRKEEEDKGAEAQAMKEAKAAAMYNQMASGNPQAGGGMAHGGIADLGSYSDGGRLLRGPGDGMSDNIPASIGGKQPARLADGEFVVPADVVSHLGNGSTDAGAKTLYSMMDKVRKARTGNKKQGKEINPDKYIPGMAKGGIATLADGGNTKDAKEDTAQTVEVQQPAAYNPSIYNPATYNYSQYTVANRPSGNAPQYYGDIYQGSTPDYSTSGYTLTGGNLGRWSNVAGEAQRAAQPASLNQRVTQDYLQQLGRAPDQNGFNYWMQSGLTAPQISKGIQQSPESYQIGNATAKDYLTGLYQSQLGRAPDQEGLEYWASQMKGGMTPQQVMQGFQGSKEYAALHPSGAPTSGIQYSQPKTPTVRSKTVQDMIDEALAKYKADNPTYTPPSYNMDFSGGGGGGGAGGE